MTAVTEEAPADAGPAPENTADSAGSATDGDPDSGLTEEDLRAIAMAHAQVFRVCSLASSRMLNRERPGAVQAIADAEDELAKARSDLEGPQAAVDRLGAELDECRRRAGEIQLAGEDESLTVRLEARSLKVAVEEETAALEERIRRASRVTDPVVVSVAAAERKLKAARSLLRALDDAIEFPFTSELGKTTEPHRQYMLATGTWFGSASRDAENIVIRHLRSTGLGDRLQRDAILAFTSGDPRAVAAGGNIKRWQDGTELTHVPGGGPDIVRNSHATPEGLASAPPVPQSPGPSAAEVMGGIMAGAGWPAGAPEAVTKAAPGRRPDGWWGLGEFLEQASR